MFSKLFKKKEMTSDDKSTYYISKMVENGQTYLLRFKNDMWEFAFSKKFPYQIGIAVPLKTKDNMPDNTENEQLLIMERIIEKEFEKDQVAIFVGTVMGGGMKEFILYTGDPEKTTKVLEKLKKEIQHHDLQYIIRDDPNWEVYKTYGHSTK